jgi:lysophospholipase L1-like esterase
MIKNILAVGDSFTYGEELEDRNLAWPSLLASRLQALVTNLGEPASSNDKILRKTIEVLINPMNITPDLVIIAWADPGRSEWADDGGFYDVWPGYGGKLFIRDSAFWREDLLRYINKYHNSAWFHRKFLQQVILLQNFLQNKNIKYVMLNTSQNEYYKRAFFDGKTWYTDQIDQTYFLGFEKEGMTEWNYKLPQGPNGHFLEEGHQQVAEKIYEHIRNLGWIS